MKNSSKKVFFLKSINILFSDLPNAETILSRIQEIPASARSVERRITDIAKQNVGLQKAAAFSDATDQKY